MPEHLGSQADIRTAPPGGNQALGYMGLGGATQVETGTTLGAESKIAIVEAANFQGNWMLAQGERMAGPDFKSKYNKLVAESMPSLKEGNPGIFDKPEHFQAYHRALADTYDSRSEYVYSAVGYVPSRVYGLSSHQTGRGGIGERGTVFTDATTRDGIPLTNRQKDVIAAHEAYHGMVKVPVSAQAVLSKAFDNEVYYDEIVDGEGLRQPGYLQKPDELMARMAQLKNYFGMKGEEEFTKDHLDYARAQYVEDTGLDNSMSIVFRIVSPKTEPDFLRAMNSLPI
jgi:hypothetical protein